MKWATPLICAALLIASGFAWSASDKLICGDGFCLDDQGGFLLAQAPEDPALDGDSYVATRSKGRGENAISYILTAHVTAEKDGIFINGMANNPAGVRQTLLLGNNGKVIKSCLGKNICTAIWLKKDMRANSNDLGLVVALAPSGQISIQTRVDRP